MRIIALLATIALLLPAQAAEKIKVACVGNSITYGLTVENREQNAYPAVLQRLLGDERYEVHNFGRSSATLLEKGHFPYAKQSICDSLLAFKPDIAVIHLGINDTDPRNWPNYNSEFITDYVRLINRLKEANPNVRVLVARLTPITAKHHRFRSGTRYWRLQVQKAIEQVALAAGAELIDFNAPLRDRQNLLWDSVHPNAEGLRLLAETAYKAITGNYGGLQLPEIWQSGMVVQRGRPLTISGTADAGSTVTLRLDGVKRSTRANNRGEWQIITAPLVAGGPYTLTVSDGKKTIELTDILAGELWIAGGQSNMEFSLSASTGGDSCIQHADDPQLRIYNFEAIANTYDNVWSDSIRALTDALHYFRPARWEKMSNENAGKFSAVAYHFARALRDSLQVPVGVIINAAGGATTESWVDVNTLEQVMPEILVNWQKNDYVHPWAQKRALLNADEHRHPFEPGYLFGAVIRPLGAVEAAGIIWYQGESNAHNIELHEQLFPAMIQSWRSHFRQPDMPVIFAQLSGIDRPSWPQFRDSQRRLAHTIPNSYITVTFDHGDSLNVHPPHKRPVGERMARQALRHIYGYANLAADSPEPLKATEHNGMVTVRFANADGWKVRSGTSLFELAGADGIFHPAEFHAADNGTITLHTPAVATPCKVRYAWRPFTRPNIFNSNNLPLGTFEMETEHNESLQPEQGIEHGVSGLGATLVNNRLIMAGGCNFPIDPLGAKSQKKFYEGIYACNPADGNPTRIGSLPLPMAYMGYCPQGDKLILIGGVSNSDGLKHTLEITFEGGKAAIAQLAPLPFTFDNGAAAATSNGRIFIAGGNMNRTPSRELWALENGKWSKFATMPGNPRVQPVMVTAKNGDGEECLFIWGGFAPRHGKHEPTLELDGLCLNLKTKKWSILPALTDAAGDKLSVGGGTACTLSDGKIAVCGGVNKDIFIEALRNQAPDYLDHPVAWYRFNPNVIIFNPADNTQRVAATSPDYARAGAAMTATPCNGFILIGGEVRPRIRTAEIEIFKQ